MSADRPAPAWIADALMVSDLEGDIDDIATAILSRLPMQGIQRAIAEAISPPESSEPGALSHAIAARAARAVWVTLSGPDGAPAPEPGEPWPQADRDALNAAVDSPGHRAALERSYRADLDSAQAALDELGVPRVHEVTGEGITEDEIGRLYEWALPRAHTRILGACNVSRYGTIDAPATIMALIDDSALTSDQRRARAECASACNEIGGFERLLTLPERIRWLGAERDCLRAVVDHPVDRSGA